MSSDSPNSVGEGIVTGTLWIGSWRWTARLTGFLSMVVLARLLMPDDFGIVATGLILVAFFDKLTDFGTDNYLIRLPSPDREDYDTAWTLRLMVIVFASIVLFFVATPIAAYFADERLVNVIRVLVIANMLRGFTNIGLTMYRRDLQYRKIAYAGLGQRLLGTFVTLIFAFVLQNYWAMIIGEVVLRIAEFALSYFIHPFRPRFSLARVTKQWDFCKWMVVKNLATFLQGQGDNFVVAKYYGIELMGFYAMAMRLAVLPTVQLVAPMLSPVYSGLAKKQGDPVQFRRSVLQVMGATTAIVMPAATLVATLSQPIVITVFGSKWDAVVPLVAPLVYAIAAGVLNRPVVTTLTLLGRVKLVAVLHWISALTLISVIYSVAQIANLEWVAITRAAIALVLLVLYYGLLARALQMSWWKIIAAIYRPCIASLVMATLTVSITMLPYSPWIIILIALFSGPVLYMVCVYLLWRLSGSPESGEALLIRKVSKILSRKFGFLKGGSE